MDYPRVTEILRPFTGYENVPAQTLKNAAARGSSVHSLCAGIARGNWIPDSMIDETLQGYVKSFNLWKDAQVESFEIIEKRYQCHEKMFSGQLDFVVKGTDGVLYLVDLKTSAKPQKTYPIQMAAYDYLLEQSDIKVEATMLVYLDKTGEFPNIDLIEDLTRERNVFFSALQCWHYFNQKKKTERKAA